MKKLICKFFGHKPMNEKVILKCQDDNGSTYEAICKRCNKRLFGASKIGELSGELIKTYIELD